MKNIQKVTMILLCIVNQVIVARESEPHKIMPAYNNRISQISYSIGSHDQYAITFLCQKNPICMYTPLRYEDSDEESLTKTYFLPRTQCHTSQMRYFYEDIQDVFKQIGIDVKINAVQDFNYGLQVTFTMQPNDGYDIHKIIDTDKNTITFMIATKI